MKKTQFAPIYPLSLGLDLSAIPGTQDKRSLTRASNISLRSKPSIKKRPGLRRIPHIGSADGVQAACQFIATNGTSQKSEIIRARKGRLEVLREVGPGEPAFVDLDVSFSDTDVITFERFANVLIIHFENRRPLYYSIDGTISNLPILSSHENSPPTFSRSHDFRLWYSGRPESPHSIWVTAINDISDYSLNGGGFRMTVKDGDGDPVGITGISEPFRGDLYVYKWQAVYRIFRSGYGYGIDEVTNEVGAVHHNAIKNTMNDIYAVSNDGIHSLQATDKYGAAEAATITYPIYEYFQENVNWSSAKNIVLAYDPPSASLLMSYASSGSPVNNRVLGYNTISKQFYEWEDCEYPAMFKFFDMGRRRVTAVADSTHGLCVLDGAENTLNGAPITLDVETGQIFPMGNPKLQVTFTNAWLVCRPTTNSVDITVSYSLDGGEPIERTVNTLSEGYGSSISDGDQGLEGGIIGEEIIGKMKGDMIILPFDCVGDAGAISFRITQTPSEEDADQSCEIYGLIYEFDYTEDKLSPVKI